MKSNHSQLSATTMVLSEIIDFNPCVSSCLCTVNQKRSDDMDVMTLKNSNIEAPRMFQTAVQGSAPISPMTSGKSLFIFPTNSASQVNNYGLNSSNHGPSPTNSASQANNYDLSSSNHGPSSLNNKDYDYGFSSSNDNHLSIDMYISASEDETVKDDKNMNRDMYISASEDDTFKEEKNMNKESLGLTDGEERYHRLVKEAVDQLDEQNSAKNSSLATSIPTKISWEKDESNKPTEESDDSKTFKLSMDLEPKPNDILIKNEENNLSFGSYVHVDSHAHQSYISEMKDDTNYSVQQQNSLLDQENNLLDDDDSSESCCSEVSSMENYLPPGNPEDIVRLKKVHDMILKLQERIHTEDPVEDPALTNVK